MCQAHLTLATQLFPSRRPLSRCAAGLFSWNSSQTILAKHFSIGKPQRTGRSVDQSSRIPPRRRALRTIPAGNHPQPPPPRINPPGKARGGSFPGVFRGKRWGVLIHTEVGPVVRPAQVIMSSRTIGPTYETAYPSTRKNSSSGLQSAIPRPPSRESVRWTERNLPGAWGKRPGIHRIAPPSMIRAGDVRSHKLAWKHGSFGQLAQRIVTWHFARIRHGKGQPAEVPSCVHCSFLSFSEASP